MNDAFSELGTTLQSVWRRLKQGAEDTTSALNTVVLSTTSSDGPKSRIVILRNVSQPLQQVVFFSHAASGKISDLARDPRAEILGWDPVARFQIRLAAEIEISEIDAGAWAEIGAGARLNYAVNPSPGTPIPLPESAWKATPNREQMAVLTAIIHRIETLQISPEGLRRAVFEGGRSQWIAP